MLLTMFNDGTGYACGIGAIKREDGVIVRGRGDVVYGGPDMIRT